MQRAQLCAGLGIGIMLATSAATAGQVDLSVEARLGGESNVFRSEDAPVQNRDPVEDGTFEITPRLGVSERSDDLSYSIHYQPTHRTFMETSGIDGFDHRARATGGWSLSAVDRIEATGSYYNGRQFRTEVSDAGPAQSFEFNDRERVGIAEANLGYQRLLSPRLSLGLGFDFEDFDAGTDFNSQTDSRAYTGRVSLQYSLDEITQIGVSASGRRRENRAVDPSPLIPRASTDTDVWDVLFSVSRALSPTMDLSIQAGPSLIRQQQIPSDSPFFPQVKEESRDVTVFAVISAQKRWQRSDAALSYVRSESRSGSVSTSSSISDVVELSATHRVNEQWTLRANGSWNRLDQVADQSGDLNRFELTAYRTTGSVEYALSRRLAVIGRYSYLWQETRRSQAPVSTQVDIHLGSVGLRYTFEPLSY